MSALDKIAELHAVAVRAKVPTGLCVVCRVAWPCPTRRLCDEAADERATTARVALDAMAARDAARADAERLAAAARAVEDAIPYDLANDPVLGHAFYALHDARAAHDALTGDKK